MSVFQHHRPYPPLTFDAQSRVLSAAEHKQAAQGNLAEQQDIDHAARELLRILKSAHNIHPSPPPGGNTQGLSFDQIAIFDAFFFTPDSTARLHDIARTILLPRGRNIKPLILKALALVNDDTALSENNPDLFMRLKCELLWLNEVFANPSSLEERHPDLLTPPLHIQPHHHSQHTGPCHIM
jgi:hypothetical protein